MTSKSPRPKSCRKSPSTAISVSKSWRSPSTTNQVNEFMALYEESISGIKEGQIVKHGRRSWSQQVMVDIGFKSKCISIKIPIPNRLKSVRKLSFLENVEDQEGQVVLSKQKADFMRVWDSIKEAHDTGNTVEGRLMRRIKGGIMVDLFGVEAFTRLANRYPSGQKLRPVYRSGIPFQDHQTQQSPTQHCGLAPCDS